jgi:hypothetical protein
MTTEQLVHDADVQGRIADGIARRPFCDVVAAMFSFDLDDRDVDFDAVERIRAGEFDDWVRATARSGLFTPREVETMARSWHANPRSLFEELLTDSDDLARRRYEIVWASLDEADTREYA